MKLRRLLILKMKIAESKIMGKTKNNTNTKSNFISPIGYSGKVTVTVKSGKNTY